MAIRAMWKGNLRLADAQVPFKLYAAIQDQDIHFRMLERERKTPIQQRMVTPEDEQPVSPAEIKKGFPSEEGFVLLSDEELKELAPTPSRDVHVSHVVARDALGPEWFLRPYYLGPDGDPEAYAALARALSESEGDAIVHWVMRNTEYTGALRAQDGYLLLVTLHHEDEVADIAALPRPSGRAHSQKEKQMAEQLVQAFADRFDPTEFHNEHRERLLELIAQKAQGKRVRLKKLVTKQEDGDLTQALAGSLEALRKTKHSASENGRTRKVSKKRGGKSREETAHA